MVKKLKSVAEELKLPFPVFKAVRGENLATVISGKPSPQGTLGPPNKLSRSLLKIIKRRWKSGMWSLQLILMLKRFLARLKIYTRYH